MDSFSEWHFNPFVRSSRLSAPKTSPLPPIAHICEYCKIIFSGQTTVRPRFSRPYYHLHQTLEQLVEAANADCRLCSMRWGLLSDAEILALEGCDHVHFNVYSEKEDVFGDVEEQNGELETPFCFVKGIDFEYCPVEEKGGLRVQNVLQIHDLEETKSYMSEAVAREASNNSQTSKNIADFWLKSCRDGHDECRSFPITGAKPKRVIDLGQGQSICPRLCMTKNLPSNFKYATLSHMWGSSQPLRLMTTSFDAMQEGMDVSQLPQTFRDAMETCRRLGIQCIWIDSLCIIQDSEDDWQEQSRDMGDIYQNAEVNIAAARTIGSDGLFSARQKSQVLPCRIEVKWANAKHGTYFVSSSLDWNTSISNSPLLARAWATQELILARRVLYFADGQMFWECYQRQANEVYPKEMPRLSGRKLTTNSEYIYGLFPTPDEKHRPFREYLLWDRILQRYTAADLTFPEKDKLVAIESVGRKVGIYDELIAGMWRKRLPYQLLWRMFHTRGSRPAQWQAPSWSWASVNGRIDPQVSENYFLWQPSSLKPREEKSLIRVVDIATIHRDNDTRQRLVGGSLRLWAHIVQGTLTKDDAVTDSPLCRFGTENVLLNFRHDCWAPPDVDRLYYLMLVLYTLDETNREYYGIWIEPSSSMNGQWSRIGFCNVIDYIWDGNIDNFERMLGKGLEDVNHVYDTDLKGDDGIPKYLIDLV